MDNFFPLIDYLNKDHYLQTFENSCSLSLETHERIENHICLDSLIVLTVSANSIILKCNSNNSKFREHDLVYLNPNGTAAINISSGVVMEFENFNPATNEIRLTNSFRNRYITSQLFNEGDLVMIDEMGESLSLVIKKDLLQINEELKKNIANYFAGNQIFQVAALDLEIFEIISNILILNVEQKEAFLLAIKTFPYSAIQGPPGTGKTVVLSAIAAYYLKKGMNVCITAVSHFAINNALNQCVATLIQLNMSNSIIKVSKNKNSGLKNGVIKTNKIQNLGKLAAPAIFGMTPFKFPHEIGRQGFPLIIMDEASQSTPPLGAMVMSYGKKIIWIGDQNQMNPVSSPFLETTLERSIFAHHCSFYPHLSTMLKKSYRMSKELIQTPSDLFYEGQLEGMHPNKRAERVGCNNELFSLKECGIFVEVPHENCTKYSQEEADFIADHIIYAIENGLYLPEEIAILVPFRAQQLCIRKAIVARKPNGYSKLLIDTVERMQGQEKKLIFYSLTLSDLNKLSAVAEFFFDPKRFNVALTRASELRVVTGSLEILKTWTDDPSVLKNIAMFADYVNREKRLKFAYLVK